MSWLTKTIGMDKANNAQKALTAQQKAAAATAGKLASGETDNLLQLQQLQKLILTPTIADSLGQLSKTTTQGGRDSLVSAFGNQQRNRALDVVGSASTAFPLSPELAKGMSLGAINDANSATAQYAADLNSPEGIQRALAAFLGSAGAGQPNYNGVGSLLGLQSGALQGVAQGAQSQMNSNLGALGTIVGLLGGL